MMYRTTSYDLDERATFYFEKNLQGDIVAVYSSSGLKLVTYTYDAWGNQTVKYWNGGGSTAAQYNPFRYRGYYYDTDLRMYYLQSRYYDSKICRFINADVYISTGYGVLGCNMFAYCNNNPVCYSDHEGKNFSYTCDYDEGYNFNGWLLEGGGIGGTGGGGSHFGLGTAYHNYAVYSSNAAYDAYLGGYYYGGGGSIGGYTAQFATGRVTVTDSMAVNRGGNTLKAGSINNAKIHGNSLKSTKTNYGYALVDSNGNILKFGETINPQTRYSQTYLNQNDATIKILIFGSKRDIHLWQHDMNEFYYYKYGEYPPLNKRGW